jgi:predicted nucleic acid-binding protein
VVLDTGAFIALERGDPVAGRMLAQLVRLRVPLLTSAGVVARVWRGGAGRQVRVTMLLQHARIVPIDEQVARLIGLVLGATGSRDAVDGHVALLAQERGWPVATSDPDDLLRIEPGLDIIRV